MSEVKAICFYLPQYHPIPENNSWWGEGFTEWLNVAKAKPLFPGHPQPRIPTDLGFYDLRLPEVREQQANLARSHGIFGFCYYHYWFNGRRLLQKPFDAVLSSGQPDFPFCLCWANENWTRGWAGGDHEILMAQNYSEADDLAHIKSLIPAFKDERYIRVNGRPFFLVYRPEKMPNPQRTAEIWREEALHAGVGDIYLAKVESFTADVHPEKLGFDATVEFAPEWRKMGASINRTRLHRMLARLGLMSDVYLKQRVIPFQVLVKRMREKSFPDYPHFKCVTPGFDNSPRRSLDAVIFIGANPQIYEEWLREVTAETLKRNQGDERIVFINAWNEWGEGNYLEPDILHGHAFLEATKRALG